MAQKVQRGAIVRKNDNGTLEWVDGSRTYIGTATLPSGKVVTKRFRRNGFDEEEVAERWLKWQGRNIEEETMTTIEEEAEMAEKKNIKHECPFSGKECGYTCPLYNENSNRCSMKMMGSALGYIAENLMRLKVDEELELVAMALGELGSPSSSKNEKQLSDGVDEFFDGKTFISFVNLHSKGVMSKYKKLCKDGGFEPISETEMMAEVLRRFPELKKKGVPGGCVFEAV